MSVRVSSKDDRGPTRVFEHLFNEFHQCVYYFLEIYKNHIDSLSHYT